MKHITPHSLENQGHRWGLRAAHLIGRDDVKCRNICPSTAKRKGFESAKRRFVFYSAQVYNSIEIK